MLLFFNHFYNALQNLFFALSLHCMFFLICFLLSSLPPCLLTSLPPCLLSSFLTFLLSYFFLHFLIFFLIAHFARAQVGVCRSQYGAMWFAYGSVPRRNRDQARHALILSWFPLWPFGPNTQRVCVLCW